MCLNNKSEGQHGPAVLSRLMNIWKNKLTANKPAWLLLKCWTKGKIAAKTRKVSNDFPAQTKIQTAELGQQNKPNIKTSVYSDTWCW